MNLLISTDPHCQFCQAPISATQAALHGGACSQTRCQLLYAQQLARHRREEQHAAEERIAQQVMTQLRQRGAIAADTPVEALLILDVPLNQRPLTELPAERKQLFLDHLRTVVEIAFRARGQAGASEQDDSSNSEEPALAQRTCASCRGGCCLQGLEHAFHTPQTIARLLAMAPEASPEEIVARYEPYLGGPTYDGSCVFHHELGCALPRSLRSSTCNAFACRTLEKARNAAFFGSQGRTVVLAGVHLLDLVTLELLPADQVSDEHGQATHGGQ